MILLNALFTSFGLSSDIGILISSSPVLILMKYLSSKFSTVALIVSIDFSSLSKCFFSAFKGSHADLFPIKLITHIVRILQIVREGVAEIGFVPRFPVASVNRAVREGSHSNICIVR